MHYRKIWILQPYQNLLQKRRNWNFKLVIIFRELKFAFYVLITPGMNQLEFGFLETHVKPNLTSTGYVHKLLKGLFVFFLLWGEILYSFQRAVHSPLLRKVSYSKNKFLIIVTHPYCNLFSLASVWRLVFFLCVCACFFNQNTKICPLQKIVWMESKALCIYVLPEV